MEKTGFKAYVTTNGIRRPVFASKRHCFFTTLKQAQNKLWGVKVNVNSRGTVIDRATGTEVWSIAL